MDPQSDSDGKRFSIFKSCVSTRDYSVFFSSAFFCFLLFSSLLFSPFYFQPSMIRTTSRPIFVVVSCGCCFLQSCIAFGILLPILYSRKCSVTFLKMQFCTATSTAMAIFTLGFSKLLPEVSWKKICIEWKRKVVRKIYLDFRTPVATIQIRAWKLKSNLSVLLLTLCSSLRRSRSIPSRRWTDH